MKLSALKELGISLLRTSLVPTVAAVILQFLAVHGIPWFSEGQVTAGVTIVLSTIYYAVFRWIELISKDYRVEKFVGIMLGYPRVKVPVDV